MKLAMKLKRLRTEKVLTQQALAERAKVSLGYVARLETGHYDPKLSTLRKLAKALGVPVTALLE
jgi:transcriptional regulator with XRE-family HTH domain